MCFNAAKSWYLGWYSKPGKEGHEEINLFRSPIWSGKLVGIDDYVNGLFDQNEHRVVVRLEGRGLNVHGGKKHFFMMFNRKKGINKGVFDFQTRSSSCNRMVPDVHPPCRGARAWSWAPLM
jgi:hypothetical protein